MVFGFLRHHWKAAAVVMSLLLLGGCVYQPYGYAAYPAYPAYAYVAPPVVGGVMIGGWGWRR